MTPDDYEGEINRLIAAEQYVDAERLVREYAACMVETCLGPAAEERFQRAKRFLQTTLGIVRAQRSHLVHRLETNRLQTAYSVSGADARHWEIRG
jgi:hypothetical protein